MGDVGGDFYTENTKIKHFNPTLLRKGSQFRPGGAQILYWGEGTVLPDLSILPAGLISGLPAMGTLKISPMPAQVSTRTELIQLGATAISRCSPTQSASQLLVTMRETLKDGLPHVPGISQQRLKQVFDDYRQKKKSGVFVGTAEEYLNIVFGWSPLIADVAATWEGMVNFHKNLDQLERDSGKVVRRSYRFPKEPPKVISHTVYPGRALPLSGIGSTSNLWSSAYGDLTLTVVREKEQWFDGAFSYYLDPGNSVVGEMRRLYQMADHAFGISPTPENLWNSQPWTWLLDWFSNAGDVIANISDMLVYGLVLRYGYMMETSVETYSLSETGMVTSNGYPVKPSLVLERTCKRRVRATPYGFGINFDSLSSKQIAILAALGITRWA